MRLGPRMATVPRSRRRPGGGGDEDEACHAGVLLFEVEDDADGCSARVDVGVEELDEALLFFERGEHGAEAIAVGGKADEVGDAVDVDGLLLDGVGGDGARPELDGVGELLVGGALVVDAAGELGADALDVPAAEVFVEEVGGGFELDGGEVVVEREDAVADHAAAGDDDGEDAALRRGAEVDVLEEVGGGGRADGEADAAGERGEDVRGALEEGGGSGDAGEAGVDAGCCEVGARGLGRCCGALVSW